MKCSIFSKTFFQSCPFFIFQGVQVRAGTGVQHHSSTIKLQEGQGREAEEDQEIKTAAENPAGTKATKHEKGRHTH